MADTKKKYLVLRNIMDPSAAKGKETKVLKGTFIDLTDAQAEHYVEVDAIRPAKASEVKAAVEETAEDK